jgi:hypothetical protein
MTENFVGGVASPQVMLYSERRLLANHGGRDDESVIFGVTGWGVFGRGLIISWT